MVEGHLYLFLPVRVELLSFMIFVGYAVPRFHRKSGTEDKIAEDKITVWISSIIFVYFPFVFGSRLSMKILMCVVWELRCE